ncbi:TBC1 domain family member 2A isoform X2 [Mixophyes fleayi]|uniref:TBC1 domain family member 2A isoform X2 n=1 Tax=Mixophyes fleayi TaxID=3061075 RepID=UPI003F4DF9FD
MYEMEGNGQENNIAGEVLPEIRDPETPLNDEQLVMSQVICEGDMADMIAEGFSPTPNKEDEKVKSKKLCGYLYKLGMKGPLKAWKYRFFSYDEQKCCLLYYRMASDVCPLGCIELCTSTFHLSVQAEEGMFQIKTPTKAFVLKAVNNHAKMYWLQQLQLKRWEFCKNEPKINAGNVTTLEFCEDESDSHDTGASSFLSPVKTPTEVVGLSVALMPAPQESTSLQNFSLKHPWKEIQNTVRNLCGSKSTAATCRSVFHFEEVEQATEVCEVIAKPVPKLSPSPNFARKARKQNGCSQIIHEGFTSETVSFEKMSSSQHQIQALAEELKSQKDLVKLLHRALESAHQEKRACSDYLNATEEKDRLELIRHKVRQIEDLRQRVEALEQEKKDLEQCVSFKDFHIAEFKEHIQLLMEKNNAKQEVILKQNEQLLSQTDPQIASSIANETLQGLYRKIDSLTDDINAYKTQNQFLNSEIHQVTQLWRNSAEKETALLIKCSYLEARNCQIESKYLIVLRKMQEALPYLDAEYCEVIKSLIEDALQSDLKKDHHPSAVQFSSVRLAALALLVLEDEESSFYCLVDIVENIMPAEYYCNSLSGSQVDQRVFKDFLSEKLPRLTAHFQQHKIDLSLITFNWFLVVFVDSLVSEILLRVWDAFMYEGTKVIFRYALAIFKYNEEEILKLNDEMDIYQYLSFFTKTICDGRKLMNIAFNEMNPFPMKLVRNRRVAHMEKFKVELAELEKIKQEYVKKNEKHGSADIDMGVSEDEEDT